jgi:hypothetical protein
MKQRIHFAAVEVKEEQTQCRAILIHIPQVPD